jgi:protocatechuate 3,4-dioxygenase beta subunit
MRGLALVLALFALPLEAAQTPSQPRPTQQATGTARINGRVVHAETGIAVRMATVTLISPDTAARTTAADADGRFEFPDLPAGRYTIRVVKAGFVTGTFGQSASNSSAIVLQDAQRYEQGDVRLSPGGVITGRVVDALGDPVVEASVNAFRAEYIQPGIRRLSAGRGVQTNDLGDFRVYGLAPGKYYVGASLRALPPVMPGDSGNGPPRIVASSGGAATTFFPGTAIASDARLITVEAGKEAPGVDIVLQSVRLARLSGTVVDSRGRPSPDVIVWLNAARGDGALIPSGGGAFDAVEVDAAGRFTLPNIAPGDYRLDVQSKAKMAAIAKSGSVGLGGAGPLDEFASVPLTVTGENIDSLMVQTTRGARMTGRLVVEGAALPPDALARTTISVMPVLQSTGLSGTLLIAGAKVQADGAFEVHGLIGMRLVRVNGLPAGMALKSVRANGMDVTDDGLEIGQSDVTDVEIVVTASPAKVTGTVTDSSGKPERDYVVVIFPEDKRRWTAPMNRFVLLAKPGGDGGFTVPALPAGNYLAVALASADSGEWAEPDNLDRLRARATAFALADRESKTLALVRR